MTHTTKLRIQLTFVTIYTTGSTNLRIHENTKIDIHEFK